VTSVPPGGAGATDRLNCSPTPKLPATGRGDRGVAVPWMAASARGSGGGAIGAGAPTAAAALNSASHGMHRRIGEVPAGTKPLPSYT